MEELITTVINCVDSASDSLVSTEHKLLEAIYTDNISDSLIATESVLTNINLISLPTDKRRMIELCSSSALYLSLLTDI